MTAARAARPQTTLLTRELSAFYGVRQAVGEVSLSFESRAVSALIGPSGCGKTTLLRCLNRIHEVLPGAYSTGTVELDGENIYDAGVSLTALRRRIGMVFQRPNPFPTLSIAGNVLAGLRGHMTADAKLQRAEEALRAAALWDEVKDRLRESAMDLSGGQQQRLCIARALAVQPEVLLMDEPTASLDPIATANIEELIRQLAHSYTIVVVTHNMQQAARVSDTTAFMLADETGVGRVVETGSTQQMFTKPADRRTEDYITGRFG
jgi:phosphate transport system ATP-binding protein